MAVINKIDWAGGCVGAGGVGVLGVVGVGVGVLVLLPGVWEDGWREELVLSDGVRVVGEAGEMEAVRVDDER